MVVLQFTIFYSLIYFLGRGIAEIINTVNRSDINFKQLEIFGIKFNFFYPIIALFFIGNFLTLINFFTGVNSWWINFIFIIILLFNFKRISRFKFSLEGFINYFVVPALFSVSTFNIGIHSDSHLYHFNYQNWIRSEKLALGLTNISGRFGYSSIYDYISSVFWIEGNAAYFHFLNLTFFVIFFNFLLINLFNKRKGLLFFSSYFILGYGLLDNFGFGGGRNGFLYIEGIGKQDIAFAVIFFITSILIITSIIKKEISDMEILIASMLVLFSSQLRLLGTTTLILFLFCFFRLLNYRELKIIKILTHFKILILLGPLWVLKNILITGCAIYPVSEKLCFTQLSWYRPDSARYEAEVIADAFYGLTTEKNLKAWFDHWTASQLNNNIARNFLLSCFILIIIRAVFLRNKLKVNKLDAIFIFSYLGLNFYPWINSGPSTRFAIGFLILFIALIGIGDFEYRFQNTVLQFIESKKIILFVMLLCIFLIPKLSMYKTFVESPNYFPIIDSPVVKTVPNPNGWGLVPEFGDECNINLNCIPYPVGVRLEINSYGYKVFK
jgi:hypothetical protein